MLKLYLPHYRNNPTFAIRFSYASIAVDLILKIRQYMKRLHWILLLMILLIPTESISAKKRKQRKVTEKSGAT
mgnify:CR=1 FL=1